MIYELKEFFRNITRGEAIITCIAFVVWTTICIFINMAISSAVDKSHEVYYKAIQISGDEKLFEYAMRTDAGDALVYGNVTPVDLVSDEMLKNKYLAIKVYVDKYVEKVRYEDITDEDGEVIGQRAVHYEEWESYRTVETHAENVKFLGVEFPYSKLSLSNYTLLDLDETTVKSEYTDKSRMNYIYPDGRFFASIGDIRYRYYVIPIEQRITVLANLRDSNMYNIKHENDSVDVYYDQTIEEVVKSATGFKSLPNIAFSIFWYGLFIALACAFVLSRNKWADC